MLKNARLSRKINLLILFCVLVSISILSFRLLRLSKNMLIENSGNIALDVAAITSATIDPQEFKNLVATKDANSDYYKSLQSKMSFIRRVSGSKYLYAIAKNEKGEYMYVVDGSEEPAAIGTPKETYPGYEEAYAGESYVEREIQIDDEYGVIVSAYQPIHYNGEVIGFVGADYNVEEAYAIFQQMRMNAILLAIALAILLLALGFIFSKRISKPLEQLEKNTNKLSEYDLTVDTLAVTSNDEIGHLTKAFNVMTQGIKDLIQDAQTTTSTISEASHSLLTISDKIHTQTNEISKAMQRVADDVTNQTHDISDGTEKTRQLAQSIETIAASIEEISNIFNQIENLNSEGFQWITHLTQKSEEAHRAFAEVNEVVQHVDQNSHQIGAILDTVRSISSQTNLLALNASIEAARSGEHGRGFAVVAEEIRKLAEETAKSTEQINHYITTIQTSSAKAVASMENSKKITDEQNEIFQKTSDIFKQLSENIRTLTEHIYQIEMLNQDMNTKKDAIVNLIHGIQASSESVSAVAQQTSASSEEIITSASSLDQFANNLAELSKKLQNQISKFKT
ncbi:MAG TPA: HAMP domain-containing protein [Clostridiales bacterium]|nr:HAMP domain-containing protein [Clostridiales bacterium]